MEFVHSEILDILKMCNGDKIPGSNDFNTKFLQDFWHLIKNNVMRLFQELYDFEKFMRSLNTTFFVLITKKRGVKNMKDFRLISLMSYIYKLIIKVMSNKLSKVLGKIIRECQHMFVGGKQILDAVML